MCSASVACKADRRAFLCYECGVLIQACGTEFDHSVLAVGYSSEGECGIDMLPSYPGVSGAPGQSPGLPLPSPQSPPTPPWTTYDEKPPYQADETEALVPGAQGSVCAPSCESGPCPTAALGHAARDGGDDALAAALGVAARDEGGSDRAAALRDAAREEGAAALADAGEDAALDEGGAALAAAHGVAARGGDALAAAPGGRCSRRKVVLIARLLWETLLGMKARLLSRMLW